MSDCNERTERATPQRRREAHRQGRVARSEDLVSALVLLCGVLLLPASIRASGQIFREHLQRAIDGVWRTPTPEFVQSVLGEAAVAVAAVFLPLVLVCVSVAFATSMLQSRFLIRPQALLPDWGRVSPAGGLLRLLSIEAGWRAVLNCAKLLVVASATVWGALPFLGLGGELASGTLMSVPLADAIGRTASHLLTVGTVATGGLLVIGVVDFFFQRWRLDVNLRMTRQEVHEEARGQQGNRQVQRAIRRQGTKRTSGRRRVALVGNGGGVS